MMFSFIEFLVCFFSNNLVLAWCVGLLQLKDPPKLFIIPKSSVQSVNPLISQNLLPRKARKQISDPILKFVQDRHIDLELVYVGQVCLSWEILCWQHKKVKELPQYDSQWPRSYNLVAGEFQLFHVLMQRFLEDEPYQGPRIQNYNNNRCVIRNLLQVPPIKGNKNFNFFLIIFTTVKEGHGLLFKMICNVKCLHCTKFFKL